MAKTQIQSKLSADCQTTIGTKWGHTLCLRGSEVEKTNHHFHLEHRWWCHVQCVTWIEGLFRWPRLDVVCLGSWPNTIMLALINLKASITTCRRQRPHMKAVISNSLKINGLYSAPKMRATMLQGSSEAATHLYLSFDALNRINHHSDGALWQGLKALLRIDVHTRQPAAKTRVTVVPSHHHLWSDEQYGRRKANMFRGYQKLA